MKRASLIGSLAAVGILWISAAPASATTFCVPDFHPACPNNGANVEQDLIQAAVSALSSDGEADTILLAPGPPIVSPGSIEATGTDQLTISGAGPDQSVLTTTANTNIYLLDLFDRPTVVQDLTVEIPQSFPDNAGPGAGVLINGSTLTNVDIRSLNDDGASAGLVVAGSGAFDNGDIYEGPGGMLGDAIRTQSGGGNLFVERVRIVGANNAYHVSQNMVATARSVEIVDPAQSAFSADNGFLIIDNSTVRGNANVVPLFAFSGGTTAGTITADHVTAVHAGGPANVAAASSLASAVSSGSPSLTVTNSIFRGYQAGAQRQALAGGSADLTVRYSNLTDNAMEFGPGTLTLENNIDEDPLFANAAGNDFHLTAGSPSIDAGDPAAATPTIDFDLFPRPEDGDGNGTAIRDQGAYEFRLDPPDPPGPGADTVAPDTTITSGPGKKKQLKKRRATFAFSANEGGSTFECKLDEGAFASCTSPASFKRLKRGKHTFAVRAIDAAGNVDASPATKTFKIKKKKRKR